jgi:Uma2 family endonuclease
MATTTRPATEQDLLNTPKDGRKYELVDGRILAMSPAGKPHGRVCVRLLLELGTFVRDRRLGEVYESSTGFRLEGGNVRVPDVSFEAEGRPAGDPGGFGDGAPDLAVEVLSPTDRPRQVMDRVGEYLQSGVRLVWVLDPERRSAVVYRSLAEVRKLGADEFLEGEDVVPGFRCRLADLFD